jgi:hypothetical protein
MSELLMNATTAVMFAALAFGVLRRPLARWRAGRQVRHAADASVPTWVAIAAAVLIVGLLVLLVQAYFGPAG